MPSVTRRTAGACHAAGAATATRASVARTVRPNAAYNLARTVQPLDDASAASVTTTHAGKCRMSLETAPMISWRLYRIYV